MPIHMAPTPPEQTKIIHQGPPQPQTNINLRAWDSSRIFHPLARLQAPTYSRLLQGSINLTHSTI